jgi:hypothetical protein
MKQHVVFCTACERCMFPGCSMLELNAPCMSPATALSFVAHCMTFWRLKVAFLAAIKATAGLDLPGLAAVLHGSSTAAVGATLVSKTAVRQGVHIRITIPCGIFVFLAYVCCWCMACHVHLQGCKPRSVFSVYVSHTPGGMTVQQPGRYVVR